jgi:hypothetical protein
VANDPRAFVQSGLCDVRISEVAASRRGPHITLQIPTMASL